ncbi:sodium:proton antiporter [Haloprofundus marisrubri]|uniref:Sodium:proton antiporter n=1 Tax=Haloprofundus marisrubri TaxID=1514971 RepID=A0A0W1RDP5_9EURY|nr:sodium:proton antiporter [Haloprofundus marisrubri]KTG11544.1 sodium:proton antiporter [Haloprofundus marisrubri]
MSLEEQLITILALLSLAVVVGILTTWFERLSYTTGLLVIGLLISLVGSPFDFELSAEFILLVLLPALIFNDAVNIDVVAFRENLVPILVLAVIGLVLSIGVIALVGPTLFGFSFAVAILFGAIVMPTDPVSVLAVFERLGVEERLTILVEGESLLNDGVSIVVYSAVLAGLLEAEARSVAVGEVLSLSEFVGVVGTGIAVALVGGVVVGTIAGYLAYELLAKLDDDLLAVVISVVLAYGVYIGLDELGASGVVGTLAAGMFFASRTNRTDISRQTHATVETTWSVAAYLANTVLFVAIGIVTPWPLLVEYAPQILVAIVVVFVARAVVVYPLVGVLNWVEHPTIPRSYQHVLTWSGIHASVSVALVLGVADEFPGVLTEQLAALVFGVATFTLLVNGQTMKPLVDRLGITD